MHIVSRILLMLLWQTAVTRLQKGTEKEDTPPCLPLGSPFNKEDVRRDQRCPVLLQALLLAENHQLTLHWSLQKH